jgi:predicted Ser/Thr protein kinase
LIEETQYRDLFDKYVTNVSYWVKGERIQNPVTGKYEDPDEDLMRRIEGRIEAGKQVDEFRRNFISTIAGAAIARPGQRVDYARLFPRYIEKLRDAYYLERRKQVGGIAIDILKLLHEESLEPERERAARETLGRMCERFGYQKSSARDALSELVRERYAS